MTSMKYTGKPVIKQLFSILDTLFSLGNYIHALNSKSVASFPCGIGDSLVLGYTPSLVSHSPDRKFLLCYWASYFTERLCLFFHLVFGYFVSVNEIAHIRITSVEQYSYFLKLDWSWNLEVLKSSFVLWVFCPSSSRGRFVGIPQSLLCGG